MRLFLRERPIPVLPNTRSIRRKEALRVSSRFKTWLSIAILALSVLMPSQVMVAQTNSTAPPEEIVKQFYRWFLSAGYPEPAKNRAKFRRYVTQKCLKEAIAADDYVYFTQAQDSDDGWKDHITVATPTIKGHAATTSVILGGKDLSDKLRIDLVQENG